MSRPQIERNRDDTGPAGAGETRPPELNYLAKDYASFRRLLLDRMAQLIPDWQERHVPDVGNALVDLMAYIGDRLSYYQDAVATEAYLGTARQRVSVRRHARLVDYAMHEGCNARAFVHVEVTEDTVLDAREIYFVTGFPGAPTGTATLSERELSEQTRLGSYEVFEPVLLKQIERISEADIKDIGRLTAVIKAQVSRNPSRPDTNKYAALNHLRARSHGTQAKRTVQALNTLLYTPDLASVLNEAHTPEQSVPATNLDVDPDVARHLRGEALYRHNLQLTRRVFDTDLRGSGQLVFFTAFNSFAVLGEPTLNNLGECMGLSLALAKDRAARASVLRNICPGYPLLIKLKHAPQSVKDSSRIVRLMTAQYVRGKKLVEVTWDASDALPADWKLKAETIEEQIEVYGNVLLVDHGRTVGGEELAGVEAPGGKEAFQTFRARLAFAPLTFAEPLHEPVLSAQQLLEQNPRGALPHLRLYSQADPWQNLDTVINVSGDPYDPRWRHEWAPKSDLLGSGPRDMHFVAELDDQGVAQIRFGDGEHGAIPEHLDESAAGYSASYRVGNGPAGNVRAGTISYLVYRDGAGRPPVTRVVQPLAARGGRAPEPLDEVRLFAPDSFRNRLERAITGDDYAAIVMHEFSERVQRAAATVRWNGRRYEALIAIDPWSSVPEGKVVELCEEIRRLLQKYRRMGHDLVVREAEYVPIELCMKITIAAHTQAGLVRPALLNLLTGRGGHFHPDNLTFGDNIYASRLIDLAHRVPGVVGASVTRLARPSSGAVGIPANDVLRLGQLQIARLANIPQILISDVVDYEQKR